MLITITAHAAPKKRAFIVGINDYVHLPKLIKAVNDANSLGATLKDLGFEVAAPLLDARADRFDFYRAWGNFLATVNEGDTVAVYFSGHGIQVRGINYLLPRDTPGAAQGEEVVRAWAVNFNELSEALERKKPKVALYILDACRDNPFQTADGKKSFGASAGLAALRSAQGEVISGAFVMYSAGANEQALDWLTIQDKDANSVYTRRLLPLLKTPGLSLLEIAKRIQSEVADDARTKHFIDGKHRRHSQRPAYYDGIEGQYYLAGLAAPVATPAPTPAPGSALVGAPPPMSAAALEWQDVKASRNLGVLQTFRERHRGDPLYVALADDAIESVRAAIAAAVPPPPASKAPPAAPALGPRPAVREASAAPAAAPAPPAKPTHRIAALTPGSGQSARDCDDKDADGQFICPEMVVVPKGQFTMGSNDYDDEKPPRPVTIAAPFAVGKYEVTFAEWDACVAGGGCQSNKEPDDQGWKRIRQPVINVSWDHAQEYVAWLKKKTGHDYRLLTEAEWEYAARATTDVKNNSKYFWGDAIGRNNANCDGCGSQWDNKQTAPVGQFKANAWGLHDMHGNVWEWVADCWHADYKGAPPDGSELKEACTDRSRRVLRGGSWNGDPRNLRSASRSRDSTGVQNWYLGLRVARTF